MTGGDGYNLKSRSHKYGNSILDLVVRYLKKESPVAPAVESRILFVNETLSNTNSAFLTNPNIVTMYVMIFIVRTFAVYLAGC